MGNCNSLSNNTRGSIIDSSERDSNRHPSSSSTRINHHPTTSSSSISHPQQQTPFGPSPYYYHDDTYDDHHAREQARPAPQVLPTTPGPRNNSTLAIFDRDNTTTSSSTRSSFVSRIRLSPGSARSNSGRSLRRLVNLAAGPRSRQQQQQDEGVEHSSRLAVQQGGRERTDATVTGTSTSSTRQNRAITTVVDENDLSYHPSSTTSNSDILEHQPTWSVSSTDEHVLTTSSNSLNDRLPVVVVDHNSDNDSITGSSATPNNNASVEENSSSHSNAAVASASSNYNPYSVSLGFSPLGVSATRRQSSGTPRLIFRRPQRTTVTSSSNNNNTRRSTSSSIRNNNTTTNRSPVRSTFSTTSVGGSSTSGGRTRTSWQASDSLGDEHYFFTYSAPPASSSRSSSSGTTGGNSSPTTISRSTHSNTSGSTASSLAALSSRHNNRRRRGTTPAQAISRLATAGSSAAGQDQEDPFSTYNARLRRRLRAGRESRDAEGEESTTLVSSDRPFSSLIHPESAESDHNSPDQRRRRRRRTFQFGNSLPRRNNGRGSGGDNNHNNNRSGITAEAYGPALFPLRRDQGAGDDNNNNDGDNTPNTNNTTGLPLDLEELYRELRVMEHLFANLFPGAGNLFEAAAQEAAFQASWNAANADPQNSTGPPAASAKAIRQLPTIQVAEIDLIDESNRECCICFEPHNLGDKLTRLPCGHLFHGPCVQEWLHKHCTCPVCRYELETDDAQYEVGRRERMKHRKPRYHRYELERMTIRELRELMSKCRIALVKGSATEKNDLVDLIVNSGRITVISTAPVPSVSDPDTKSSGPGTAAAASAASATTAASAASTPATEPVHFRLSELRRMSIGSLKKIMTDHGVFYDPADVVEKEDMVQIFINSGRCIVVPEQEEEDDDEEEVRMRDDEEDGNNNADEESPLPPMNEDVGLGDPQGDHDMDDGQMIEHEDEEQDAAADENIMSDSASGVEGFSVPASLESSIVDVTNHDVMTSTDVGRQQQQQQQQEEGRASGDEHNVSDGTGPNTSASATAPTAANSNEEDWEMVDDNAASNSNPTTHTSAAAVATAATAAESEPGSTTTTNDQDQARHLTGLSISQLKQLAYELNVNVNDCLEKREMIERIADAAMARRAHSGGSATSAQ